MHCAVLPFSFWPGTVDISILRATARQQAIEFYSIAPNQQFRCHHRPRPYPCEADSAVILAKGRAEVQEIEARTVDRLRKREVRRQQNIESITLKAFDELPPPEQLSDEKASEDWTISLL